MVWLLAVIAVVLMAGVAAVAAGHGEPMAPEFGDRPDAGLPGEGPVTASQLRAVRLPVVLRGYRMAEVDALIERLAAEREELDAYRRPADASGATAEEEAADRAGPTDGAH